MAFEADRVVVEVIAKMDGLDTPVKQSAATFDASMNKIAASAAKAETAVTKSSAARVSALQRESAQITAAMKIIGTQVNDVGAILASPNSPFVAPVKQAPQVSSALRLVSTGASIMGGVLGGIAVSGAVALVAALVELIRKSDDTSSAIDRLVEKLKEDAEKAQLAKQAQAIFGQTLEGVTKALDDNEEALKRLNHQGETAEKTALRNAIVAKMRLEQIRDETKALLDQALAQIEVNNARAGLEHVKGTADPALVAADEARKRIEGLQKKVNDTTAQITRSQQQITEAASRVAVAAGERMADPLERIKAKYEGSHGLIELARQRALREGKTTEEIAKQTVLLKQQEAAELKAAQARKSKASSGTGEFGRQVSFDEAASIARSAGLTVNSAFRSTARQAALFNDPNVNRPGNPVARPGTSAHEGINGKWALDIAFAPGLTPEKIKKVFGDEGVTLSAVFKEKGHFHIEGSRSQAAAQERSQAAQEREAARIAEQEQQRLERYVNAKADIEDQILDSRRDLLISSDAVAEFYRAELENAKGLVEKGNIDIMHRPQVHNPDGSISTVQSMSFGTDKGEVLVPKVVGNKVVSDQEAMDHYKQTGEHLGIFDTPEHANEYAENLHKQQEALLAAGQKQLSAAELVAEIEHTAVEVARQKYEDNVKSLEDQGKYTAEEAQQLIDLNNERAKLRDQLVERRKQQAIFVQQEARNENALTVQAGLFDAQKELLQSEEGLAKTASERKRIEDRLIDIEFEEERMRLQAQISLADRLKAEAARTKSAQDIAAAERAEADAAVARARLANLPAEKANAHTANAQTNAAPLQDYLQSIPHTADQIDVALQNIAVHGLQSFVDGLTDAIVNFKSLKDVALNVLHVITEELVKLAIQMVIFKAFQAAGFPGLSGGGPVGMATGGRIRGYAPGGYISGPGGPTSDSVPIMASAGEFIVRTEAARKIGYGTLDYINRQGELPHFADGGQVRRIAPVNERAWSQHNSAELSPQAVQTLRSIVSEAAAAMPQVDLYASLDPAEALQKALGTQTGHRALLAHFRANSGAFNASLRPGG